VKTHIRFEDQATPEKPSFRFLSLHGAILGVVALLALVLRYYRLDFQSLWYDELFSLSISRQPFAQLNDALIKDVVHPPFHYYLLHGWFRMVGFGPFQGRLLSLIFGVLAVGMIYVLARYLFDSATALIAALLLACSQIAIMYSQEARPYAMAMLLSLYCAYFHLRAWREKTLPLWIAFLASIGLLLYTHYYGIFAVIALALFNVFYHRRYRLPWAWLIGGALVLVLAYIPWLAGGVVHEALYGRRYHLAVAAPAPVAAAPVAAQSGEHWYTAFTVLNIFNNGRPNGMLDSSPLWSFVLGGILFTLPATVALCYFVRKRDAEPGEDIERENLVSLVLLSAMPVILALTVAHFAGAYNVRYISYCAAPYYVLVARGLTAIRPTTVRYLWLAGILLYSANALRANYSVPYKEDYKHSLAWIASAAQPGDCSAVAQFWEVPQARWAWSIYQPGHPEPQIRLLEEILAAPSTCQRVWLLSVFYRGNPVAVRVAETARQKLQKDYLPGPRKRFFWETVDLFTRNAAAPRP
jgi:4-amino-4-deoxy-L-arabinose transferase-like glycosyltransferase